MASHGPQLSQIVDYFINRHIFLKEEWLDEVLKYLKDSRLSSEALCKAVFEQWLHSDISESTNPFFQKPNGIVGFCEGCFVMQILNVVDIGTSFWTQFRNVTHVADNFDFFDAIPKEEIPAEIQQSEKSKKMLFFELSDGVQSVKAIEYRNLNEFSIHVPPGSKVLLYGKIKMRNGILWLTEKNIQLLGGDLYSLCSKNRPEAVLGRLLNMEKYKEEEPSTTPDTNTQKFKKPVIPTSVARRPIQQVVNMSQRTALSPVNVNVQNRNNHQSLKNTRASTTSEVFPDVTMVSIVEQNNLNTEFSSSNNLTETSDVLETEADVMTELSSVMMSDLSNTRTSDVSTSRMSDTSNHRVSETLDIKNVVITHHRVSDTAQNKVLDTFDMKNFNLSKTRTSDVSNSRISDVSSHKISDTPDVKNFTFSNQKISDASQHRIPDTLELTNIAVSQHRVPDTFNINNFDSSNVKNPEISNSRESDDSDIEMIEYKPADLESISNFYKTQESKRVVPPTPESSPLRSPQAKKSRVSTVLQELEMPTEENEVVTKFKSLKLVKISEACRLMKFSIGSKRMKILAIMVEEIDPFRTEDDEWTMTISIRDDSHSGLECLVSHELLCGLISMTPAEAIAVKNSTNVVKKREGKKRLESLYVQLSRLDLVFEVEFFSANRVMPKIVGLSTLYDTVFF